MDVNHLARYREYVASLSDEGLTPSYQEWERMRGVKGCRVLTDWGFRA